MNGIHDVGGMDGHGPVVREENEPVFHEPWEGRMRAIHMLLMRKHRIYNLDESRHYVERIDPVYYLGATYYQLWLCRMEVLLIERGVLTEEEIQLQTAELCPASEPTSPLLPYRRVLGPIRSDRRTFIHGSINLAAKEREQGQTGFLPGSMVRVKVMSPLGHTRAPRYIRGKRGVIEKIHGSFILPDVRVHEGVDLYQTVYLVRFEARELWGDDASSKDKVYIELWEDYMESEGEPHEQQ